MAGSRNLLPQPQKVQAGEGRLLLNALSIRFAMNPAVEDRFAAQELSTILSESLGGLVPVVEAKGTGKAVLLTRTGNVDPLPLPDERTGPESREAWLAEYTEYRLDSTLVRWDAEYEYWRRLVDRFRAFSSRMKDGDRLPPLSSVIKGQNER